MKQPFYYSRHFGNRHFGTVDIMGIDVIVVDILGIPVDIIALPQGQTETLAQFKEFERLEKSRSSELIKLFFHNC